MTRKKYNHYLPVTIESLQPDGEWNIRNSFIADNTKVLAGSMDREELLAKARRKMVEWTCTYSNDSQLRISNGGK